MARPFPPGARSDTTGVGAARTNSRPRMPDWITGGCSPPSCSWLRWASYVLTVAHDWLSLDVWSAHFGLEHRHDGQPIGGRGGDAAARGHPASRAVRPRVGERSSGDHESCRRRRGRDPCLLAARRGDVHALARRRHGRPPDSRVCGARVSHTREPPASPHRCRSRRPRSPSPPRCGACAANGIWPHTLTILGITGMAWASSTRRWWLVGVFGGIALLGRLHVAVIVAILGLLVAWARRDPRIVLRVGVGSAAFVVVLCAWNYWVYGTWSPSAAYETSMFAEYARNKGFELAPNQLGTWFAPDRGLFVWTPVLVVLAPALVRSWRNLPDWSRALVWGSRLQRPAVPARRLRRRIRLLRVPARARDAGVHHARRRAVRSACRQAGPSLDRSRAGRAAVRDRDRCHCRHPHHAATRQRLAREPLSTTIADMGPVGWALILGVMLLGVWVSRLWVDLTQPSRAEPSTPAGP